MGAEAIDLFAGAGGFTCGAEAAGVRVVWAANHWPAAVDAHRRNHPGAAHACQDLHQADWSTVPRHDVLLASPACQGHSRARGKDRPRHDASRSTAWAVVSALESHRAPVAVVENVPDFARWALYPAWTQALAALGYSVAMHAIDAADVGVPQHRVRLFLVLSRSRAPLHLALPQVPHVGAETVVDFGAGRWSAIDAPGRSEATLARVRAGREAHGGRFLVAYYGTAQGGRSLARPLGTLTTRARYAVVDGDRMRMLSVDEQRRAMGFPAGYWLPSNVAVATHLLGNAVCPPVATAILRAIEAQA